MRRILSRFALAILLMPAGILPAMAGDRPGAPMAQATTADISKGLHLVMVEAPGCPFCARWRREILPIYAETAMGQAAPVSVIALGGPWPDNLVLDGRPQASPTFLLLADGIEQARFTGYAGPAPFWAALHQALGR